MSIVECAPLRQDIPHSHGGGPEVLGRCRVCDAPAALVALTEDTLTVVGPDRTVVCRAPSMHAAAEVAAALQAGDMRAAALVLGAPAGWLDQYCYACSAFYCGAHFPSEMVFDDGYHEDTKSHCPQGHWQSILPRDSDNDPGNEPSGKSAEVK